MGDSDSWERRWYYCFRCEQITPHKPYLQNWGPAHTECIICGDRDVFAEFRKIHKTERRYINARKATTPRKAKQE